MTKVALLQKLNASFGKLTIVKPQIEMLSETNRHLVIENVALQWEVFSEELVAHHGDAIWRSVLRGLHLR